MTSGAAFERGQAELEGELHQPRVRRRKSVLCAESLAGPFRSGLRGPDAGNLAHEPVPQSGRAFRIEHRRAHTSAIAVGPTRIGVLRRFTSVAACWTLELRTPMQVRSIEVILARDADQGEKGVTSRVGQGGAMPCGSRYRRSI